MKRIIDISDDTFNILKNMIEADCVDPYSLADIIVNKSIPYEEKSSDENVQTQSLISRYQNDFVSSQTEVVKVGEPLPNSDEINKALEKGEMYKRGFDDAMRRFKRPQGEWLWLCDSPDPKYKWSCNTCGRGVKEQENFCPNCGVEMKGGKECMDEDAKQASIPYTYNAPQHDWKCGYPDITRGEENGKT